MPMALDMPANFAVLSKDGYALRDLVSHATESPVIWALFKLYSIA
jgi:hypothetical protein